MALKRQLFEFKFESILRENSLTSKVDRDSSNIVYPQYLKIRSN